MRVAVFAMALTVLAGASLAAPATPPAPASASVMPVKTLQIVNNTADHQIAIKYPQTGIVAIDREIAAWAKQRSTEFVKYVTEARQDGSPWSLSIAYGIARNDAQMFEIVFKGQMADDGNHTHFDFTTFNYLMPAAHRVLVAEIVSPAAYAKMRAYAAAHMVAQDPEYGAEVADAQALPPQEESFAAFAISPASITFWFTPEQLGNMTSAGGHATIPLTELKGLIRSNWRAPAASFDCAKAASPVEKAVCSNVALARLDREMAATYRLHLQGAADAGATERMRKDQQAWLDVRSHACPAGPGIVGCLSRAYRARIATLKKI